MTSVSRFHIRTLGCKVNWSESETIAAALLASGWEQSDDAADCNLAIVNTCTVTAESEAKNRKLIRALLRTTDGPVLVTGCAVNVDADHYADIDERVTCVQDKSMIPEVASTIVRDALQTSSVGSPCAGDALQASRPRHDDSPKRIAMIRARGDESFRTRVDLKIQDGCDNACSYCIVHVARGPARSVPADQIVEQARAIADQGTRELVLVGIDLAAYRDGDIDLAALVGILYEQTRIGRVRISSVEPQSVTSGLVKTLGASDGRLCRHLHLCLQSGSSKVLAEMNRHYDAGEFEGLVNRLRIACPSIALSTDVIVGFPGESDEDFWQTYELVERCAFMRLHVFRYSKRPGTPAAERDDQVDPMVMAARSKALIDLGKRLSLEDMQHRIGMTEQVIIERPGLGTSESYHTVLCDPTLPIGSLVKLKLHDIDEQLMSFRTR